MPDTTPQAEAAAWLHSFATALEARDIPAVLTSGDHGKVERWRRAESEALTRARRPDLLK